MSSKFDYGAHVMKFWLRGTKGYRILWKSLENLSIFYDFVGHVSNFTGIQDIGYWISYKSYDTVQIRL